MNRCLDCDSLFDEPGVVRDYNGEQFLVCPFCSGRYETAYECEICGEISDSVVCDTCISELEFDYDTCFKLSGRTDKKEVLIDSLLAEVLTQEEINHVLRLFLREHRVSCRPFLEGDRVWLADAMWQEGH